MRALRQNRVLAEGGDADQPNECDGCWYKRRTREHSDAWRLGYVDHVEADCVENDNPFPPLTIEHFDWFAGWQAAQEKLAGGEDESRS